MTIQEITDTVNSRINPTTGQAGYIIRDDIHEALGVYKDPEKEIENMTTFLNQFTFMTDTLRKSILDDLSSYKY